MSLAVLSEFDFTVVVDRSGSMLTTDVQGKARWTAMQETVFALTATLANIDADGLDLVLFNNKVVTFTGADAAKLTEIFSTYTPMGSTDLAGALTEAFKIAGKSDKKDFILVITDGVPDDREAVKQVIIEQANKQNADDDLSVLFVQIGHDAAAAAYLASLDDDLKGAKFDIVDYKTQTEAENYASVVDLIIDAIKG